MKKFLIIIVAYKKDISQIEPLCFFRKHDTGDFTVFLYDNSPNSIIKSTIDDNIIYRHNPENGGVSQAYNEGAKYAKENGYNWLVLFDQDTIIKDNNFLTVLEEAIEKNPSINLFVPTVDYQDGIMSPLPCKNYRIKKSELEVGIHRLSNVAIINSGLTVSVEKFFNCGGYNKKTFLDLADFQFIERLEKIEKLYYITSSHLFQDFSNNETSHVKLFNRYKIYCQCLKGYETSLYRYILLYYRGFLHTLSLTKRTKKTKFINHFFKSLLS